MRKTTLLSMMAFGLAMSSTAMAGRVDCYGPDADQLCETVTLIDFNGDPAIESASMEFSDWTQKIQGGYAESRGDLSITKLGVSGYSGAYNHQGVKGDTPFFFASGSQIRVTFKNTSDEGFYFYPYLSFDDPDARENKLEEYDNGDWLKPETISYIPPQSEVTTFFSFDGALYNEGTFDQVSVNFHVNTPNQHLMGVDRIELTYPKNPERTACNGWDEYEVYDCDTYTLVKFLQTEERTKASMAVASFNDVLFNRWHKVSSTGVGVTTHLGANGSPAEDQIFVADYANTVGITGDEPYTFKAGDVIRVTFRTGDISGPMIMHPSISFDDPDNIPYGEAGVWYDTSEVSVQPNEWFITTEFVFDEASAGTYSLINFSPNVKHDGELAVEKFELVTRTPAAEVVR